MIDQAQVLNQAFDATRITWHDRAAALAAFKEGGRDIVIDDDGNATTFYDGETLSFTEALRRFGYDRRDLVDGRTLPRAGVSRTRPGLLSKEGMTLTEKVKFISEHGEEAFAKLPLTGVGSNEVKTKADWYKLPVAEKTRRLAADPDAFNRLPNAAPPIEPVTKLTSIPGGKINYAALERQRGIRPNG